MTLSEVSGLELPKNCYGQSVLVRGYLFVLEHPCDRPSYKGMLRGEGPIGPDLGRAGDPINRLYLRLTHRPGHATLLKLPLCKWSSDLDINSS